MKPQEAIKAYLKERCRSDRYLAEAMKNSRKSISGALDYAKKQAKAMAVGGCAVVESDQVFEWIVHYYLEDMAEIPVEPAEPAVPTPSKKASPSSDQMMLFDF